MIPAKNVRNSLLGVTVSLFGSLGLIGGVWAKPTPDPKPATPPAEKQPAEKPSEPLPKAEEILDQYVKATGGKEAYDKIKTIVIKGKFEGPMGMNGAMEMYVARPGKMLTVMNIDNLGEMRSGSDGETVWSDNPIEGPRILKGAERDMVLKSARMTDDANWRKRYTKVETVGIEDVNGKPAYKVEITTKDSSKRQAFYDKASWLMVKQAMVMQSARGAMPLETLVSDYKKVGELVLPHKTETSAAMQKFTTTFEKIDLNTDVANEKFALPADIKELKEKKAKPAEPAAPTTPSPTPPKPPEKK